jgi:hypothetical protein
MTKNIPTLLGILMLTLSCNLNNSRQDMYSDSKKIYDEAIDIHDEVMPMMGEIMNLQATLKSKKEEVSDQELINEINISLQNLEDAHNGMMLWMRNITIIPSSSEIESGISELPTKEEMLKIQKTSLENIKEVKIAITESIENAKALISGL